MSERIVPIQSRVSTSTLERAVVRLHSGKHVEKLAAIDRELRARRAEERHRKIVLEHLVDVWRERKAA